MNPTPQQIASLRAKIQSLGTSDVDDIVIQLNVNSIDNPEPQTNVPKAWTWTDVTAVLSQEHLSAILSLPTAVSMIDQLNSDDPVAAQRWMMVLSQAGMISMEEIIAITAVVSATEADPAYKPKVSWAFLNLGRSVDAHDILEAIN